MKYAYKLIILFMLQGCVPTVVAVGGIALASTIQQEKSLGSTIDDSTIWAKINSTLIRQQQFFNINVTVSEGRVLLTGIVKDLSSSLAVVDLCWKYDGVKEVINEILIQEESESILKSSWITAQIKTKLLVEHAVKSFNYTVVTIDNIVYLFGIAQNNNELNKAINIASTVEGVEKVISHVRLKTSKLRKL
ncbi:MAG: BON domain-containing protein [Rickettsiaceae bacterium H1]|nr:BON domain-containing protein [Rickettsiaceae bacterium H1]